MDTKNNELEKIFKQAIAAHRELRMDEAIDLYNTILKSEPENTVVLRVLAMALANVGGQANTEQKAQNYLDRAQDTFFKAIQSETRGIKEKAQRLLDLSMFYLQLYKLDDSIKFGKLAHKLDPMSPVICSIVGDAFRMKESLSEAVQWYEKALKLDKNHIGTHQGMGLIHKSNSDFEEAFKYFSNALKLFDGNINIPHYVRTATFAKAAGHTNEANRLCKNILEKAKPRSSLDVRAMSRACMILSDYEMAFEILNVNGSAFSGIPFKEHATLTDENVHRQNFSSLGDMTLHCDVANYKNDKSPIFFVAANEKYLKLYFENLVNGIWQFNPDQRVHIHLMLENDGIIPVLQKQISKRFSVSFEIYTPPDRTGYTIRRFYRMYQLLRSLKCPILMADIDLVCSRDISTLFEKFQNSDVGILIREHEAVINQQVLASLLYCKPNDNGLAFLRFANNYMFKLESLEDPTWFIDQMALYAAYNYYTNVEKVVNFYKIPENLIIIDYQEKRDETMFVHAKGKGKDFKVKEFNLPDAYILT